MARAGDPVATASTLTEYPLTGDSATGAWVAAPVSETTTPHTRVDGRAVVVEATCTFTFTGSLKSNGAAYTTISDVTLSPASRVLRSGGDRPLVVGDSAQDTHGNRVEVTAAGTLTTS